MLSFYIGRFYETGQANLEAFFMWHPWLYLFLIPAISMRLWAEERKSGTIELLMTLPISTTHAVLGKYFAAWSFALVALFLTFPMWLTVNYLGHPDNGSILAGYVGSFFVAGGFMAIGSCMSALTKNQVVSFVISVTVCFLFNISGLPAVLNFFGAVGFSQTMLDTISAFSFLTNFLEMSRGVISLANIVYFFSIISFWLGMNILFIEIKRG
jgi:ABC-2 type transport system permease protein